MNKMTKLLFLILITLAVKVIPSLALANTIDLSDFKEETLGQYLDYFQEQKNAPLSLIEAIDHFESAEILHGSGNSISLGIGVRPVWLKVSINNKLENTTLYRLSIETPWLDHIDA